MGIIALRSNLTNKLNQMSIPDVNQHEVFTFFASDEDSYFHFPELTPEQRTFVEYGVTEQEILAAGSSFSDCPSIKDERNYLI
jgi:hypothetical protein